MELRHLRYFVAAAEELNFTRAAVRLHIAQPALSVQIRKLESEIGVLLLSREGRNVRLTEAGQVFLAQARQILAQTTRGITLAQRAASGEAGHLTIGYNTPAELRIFRKVVPAFTRKWRDVHLTFHNLRTPEQFERLRRDELDVGFVWLPAPTEEFEVQELTREPLIALLPESHRLAASRVLSVNNLSREPLVLFARPLDPESFHEIEQLFHRVGAAMNVAYELDTLLSVINFVSMGCGCSIWPDYVRIVRQKGIVYRPLRAPNIEMRLAIIKKRRSSQLAETFYRFTVDTICVNDV